MIAVFTSLGLITVSLTLPTSFLCQEQKKPYSLTDTHCQFRIVFRIIEFSSGVGTKLELTIDTNEWFLYVFDEMPMFLALVVFLIYHPGRVLKGPDSEFPKLSKEEKLSRKVEKKRIKAEKKGNQSRGGSELRESDVRDGGLDN